MKALKRLAALGLTALLLCALAACGTSGGKKAPVAGEPPEGKPLSLAAASQGSGGGEKASLLLVTIDTWRWDYIGLSGSGKVATPNLDRLAAEGVYERECETPYPLTTPAHATILTGLLPLHHGILDCTSYSLATTAPTLAEAFAAKGVPTSAFVSSLSLDRRFGLDRGFGAYEEGTMRIARGADPDKPERDGAETTEAVLEALAGKAPGTRLFVWVHYYDAHMPYRPRPALDAVYPGNPYAAQVAFVDGEVAKLVKALHADSGRTWQIVIVGDHGEGFEDHHEMGHGTALYRSTLHVPLIFWPKPARPLVHAKPWRLEDLNATLREWFGLNAAASSDGESLFQAGGGGRFLPSLTIQPCIQYGVNPCLGVRRGAWMYMRHGVEELFDLAKDPQEARDLSRDPSGASELKELRAACDRAFPADRMEKALSSPSPASTSELDSLKGLGYIGGFSPGYTGLQKADIRDVCDTETAFYKAQEAFKKGGDPGAMQRAYESLLDRYPRAALYDQQLGVFFMSQKNLQGAAKAFERAVRLNPRDTTSLANLGGLELVAGRPERARALLEATLTLDPDDAVAQKNLGIIYAGYLKDPAKAVMHYKRYLELGPDADQEMIRKYIQDVEGGSPRKKE